MNFHVDRRLLLVAAVVGALAVLAVGFFVALGLRSVVAGPDSAPPAAPPNLGHSYDQIELPAGTWPGLDADMVDGAQGSALEESAEIDADIAAHAGNASAHHTKTTSASEIVSGAMAPQRIQGTAWTSLNDGAGSGLDADMLDAMHAGQTGTNYVPYADASGNVGIGTTNPSGKLDVNGTIKEYGNDLLPRGVIVMWSGTLASIPDGWALADGGTYTAPNGDLVTTPDLRDRFIYGTSAGENPGATGGSVSHSHTVDSHSHTVDPPNTYTSFGPYWTDKEGTAGPIYQSGNHRHEVNISPFSSEYSSPGTSSNDHLPPYFKLAFIMKL